MLETGGVIDCTSSGDVVDLGFCPAHFIFGLSSGGPVYASLISTAGTTLGYCLNSTTVSPLQLEALVNVPRAASSKGRITEFGPYLSGKTSVGATGGIRYWAMSL